ncbi:MAG: hypothetical protein KDA44_23375 [Planctomycetales bacterium]|nr:hypothetical protein [Planctomycetales bacterium]
MSYFDAIGDWIHQFFHNSWAWLNALNYHEWFLLLAVTTIAGFLCMRGFSSRFER